METVPQKCLEFLTPSLRDTTRIAASSPQMWNDIFLSNSKSVLKALDEAVLQLSILRKAISIRDSKTLIQHFTQAKEKRSLIDGSSNPTTS